MKPRWLSRLILAAVFAVPGAFGAETASRGGYLFAVAGCAACHTADADDAPHLAGGRAFETPFGTFYSPNITPDPTHGLGNWTEQQFLRALRHGRMPDGSDYYPVFPFPSYTFVTDADARAMWAHLRTVTPVAMPNREHDLPWYFSFRIANRVWKWLFLDTGPLQPDPSRSAAWNRGAYLARALAHCSECHTPRNRLGAADGSRYLAGSTQGPEGAVVPNITPDPETGIDWSERELRDYFSSGMLPDGDFVGGLMAEVIDGGLSKLTAADLDALVTYIRSVPPVRHRVD